MKHCTITGLILTVLAICLTQIDAQAAKTVKIKLTGTAFENILMTVGQSGRTEVISQMPYILEVPKSELPLKLKFQSEHYLYFDIDVPKKPYDTTGHVYLVKVNETATNWNYNNLAANSANAPHNAPVMGQTILDGPVKGLDLSRKINVAPVTGAINDKTVAVIICNEEYEMAENVDNATNDGLAFKEYCIKTLGIPSRNIKYGENLSFGKMRKNINDALDLAGLFNDEAKLIVYYAGHGIPDNKTKDAFLMPVDADGTDTDICLSLKGLYDKLNASDLKQCVVFLDACFSGEQRDGSMIVAARGVKIKPKEAEPQGKTVVFSATSGNETAFSYKQENHGLFTYYLLDKLQSSKGKASLGELAEHLKEKLSIASRQINNMPQTPTVSVAAGVSDNWKSLKLNK